MADKNSPSVPAPKKRGSATLAKTITGLEAPVRDPSKPVTIDKAPTPSPSPPPVDAAKLLKAWAINIDTMTALIEHMDGIKLDNAQTRSDAKTTRCLTLGSTALMLMVAVVALYRVDAATERMDGVAATAKATAAGVDAVHDQLGSVLAAVMAATSADVEEAIAEAEAHAEEEAAPKPTTARGRRLLAAKVRLHKPSMTALKARLEAQAVAIQAEAELAKGEDSAPAVAAGVALARKKAAVLKKRVAKLKIARDRDSPLAGLDF